jgi:uncharacterized membrane protein (UPF0127 family)
MKKVFVSLFGVAFILLLAFSATMVISKIKDPITEPSVLIGGKLIKLEIADTPAKRQTGLMARKHLDSDRGMLFIFEEPQKPVFWMKDCYISLDIIFIRGNNITGFYTSVPPCRSEPCDLYPAVELNDKVLEVNAGFIEKNNVKINDKVEFKGFKL